MEYKHIAWCKEGSHDKVWGVILLQKSISSYNDPFPQPGNKYVTFWGRRGKKLQTKLWEGRDWDAIQMFEKKQSKGYNSVDFDELNKVYPEFQKDLEKTAFWATLRS
jgi:hypothetical protein